jgi:hypothetical protein
MKDCQLYAIAGGDPITDPAAIRAIITTLDKTGLFTEDLREWRRKPTNAQTVFNLKAHFNLANMERLRSTTTTRAGFLTQVPPATAPAPAALLTHDVPAPANTPTLPATADPPRYYCWTHGLHGNSAHTSQTCTNPAPGHIRNATIGSMKGGNNTINRRRDEPAVYQPPVRNPNRTPRGRNNRAATAPASPPP